MTADTLKAESLAWLRYVKRMPVVATEVGSVWSADVVGMNSKVLIEVETKISKADLRAEFRNKAGKHYVYGAGGRAVPNYYYVLVPGELAADAELIVGQQNPKYGVLSYVTNSAALPGKRLAIVRRAQRLHDNAPSQRLVQATVARMASELCHFHLAAAELREGVVEHMRQLEKVIADQAARMCAIEVDEDVLTDLAGGPLPSSLLE